MCAYQRISEILAAADMPLDQVVVSGASAGGHLALVVGMRNSKGEHPCQVPTPPRAVVNWFGITDIEAVHEFLRKTKPESNYAASWIGDLDKMSDISAAHSPLFLVSEDNSTHHNRPQGPDSVVPFEQATACMSLSTLNRLVTMEAAITAASATPTPGRLPGDIRLYQRPDHLAQNAAQQADSTQYVAQLCYQTTQNVPKSLNPLDVGYRFVRHLSLKDDTMSRFLYQTVRATAVLVALS